MKMREDNLELIRLLVAVLVLFTFAVYGQTTKRCDHTSNRKERFDAMRLLPPSRIKNFDPSHVEIISQNSVSVFADTLNMDAETVVDKDVTKNWKDIDVWILYCSIDKHIYTIVRVLPNQIRKSKP